MEIQGDEIILSPRDIAQATLGHEAIDDPDFHAYLAGLANKFDLCMPSEVQLDFDLKDTVGVLRVPYSKKVVEMLGTVIARGVEISRPLEPVFHDIKRDQKRISQLNQESYEQQERRRRRSHLKVVRND